MLPIDDILPDLKAALMAGNRAVVMAPPGAGKTTGVPLALLEAPWLEGRKILMLEPRRLAVRAAAARMAASLGETVGARIGTVMRGESRVSMQSRLIIQTEGVLTRQLLEDPALEDVGCVIFDEFHERSLDADLGLAFCLEAQSVLRPDLKVVVMSATLDGAKITDLMAPCARLQAEGRSWPVETRYLGRRLELSPAEDIARHAARLAPVLKVQAPATCLVFLPGQAEIHRAASMIDEIGLPKGVEVFKLFGAMDFNAQKAVLSPVPPGQARLVLATDIAETSLTLDKVVMVLDAGQARVARFDPAKGLTRLVTERVTRASADQRRGRAGRTGPGVCYRLWDEEQDRSLVPYGRPEILETDVSALFLTLKLWGHDDTSSLSLLDHPSPGAWAEAGRLLRLIGALDAGGNITPQARRLAALPLSPRLAHMVLTAARIGQEATAARIAALLSQTGVGGRSADLERRLEAFDTDCSPQAQTLKALSRKWADMAKPHPAGSGRAMSAAQILSLAFPERIAMARGHSGEFVMANGRGAFVEAHNPLARAEFLAIGELGGGAGRDRILLAGELTREAIIAVHSDQIETVTRLIDGAGRPRAEEQVVFGAVVLSSHPLNQVPETLRAEFEARALKDKGLRALQLSDGFDAMRVRIKFVSGITAHGEWPDVTDSGLIDQIDQWLSPYTNGRSLTSVTAHEVEQALKTWLGYDRMKRLDMMAPARLDLPTGSSALIDYGAEGGPQAEVRVQELFGVTRHPMLGQGTVPLTLSLLSPARRPIQITRDLPAFWKGSWAEVRKEMKGRYPRHPWPDDPAGAPPTSRAKPRGT